MNKTVEKCAFDLSRAAQRVLKALRDGRNPTFEQLDKLEATLAPFTMLKMCGHVVLEECSCQELFKSD